ncbi:hypothetical protein BGZ60DRAFT_534855 [Tricladium varicosporioides]|nr:hypothetical protein BGZ60DRAFT_534855 [Hymenoscyphus varicosporioides]
MQDLRDSLPDRITPPASYITTPLTPPPTDSKPTKLALKVLDTLQQYRDGRQISKSQWHTYKIRHEEYSNLIGLIKKEESLSTFVENKFRYDYNSSTEALTLRIPSYLHEVFLASVVEEIQSKLRAFTSTESRSKAFAEKVKHYGSCRLDLQSGNNDSQVIIRREPDAMFNHCDAHWPGVIIEVSYSQKTKAIPHLADDYILETNGSVRVVIGLDIDYKTKKGTISMWRPGYVKNKQGELELEATQTLYNQIFRDESGDPNPSPDAGLRLELKDFAPEDLAEGILDFFLIDSAKLCQFLNEAEQAEQETKQERRVVQHLLPGAKKRRRDETLPEEVSSDDDHRLADNRRRVRTRDSEDDSSYKSSQ